MVESKPLVLQRNETLMASIKTPPDDVTSPGEIILIHRSDEPHPYVTWWYNTQSGGRCWGHCFKTYDAAARDFGKRVVKHFPQLETVGA
jgi:hypothetical protein